MTLKHIAFSRYYCRNIGTSKDTWIAFVDLRKAYDSVWHEGLFFQLAKIGIGGPMLNLIRQVYGQQSAQVSSLFGKTSSFDMYFLVEVYASFSM